MKSYRWGAEIGPFYEDNGGGTDRPQATSFEEKDLFVQQNLHPCSSEGVTESSQEMDHKPESLVTAVYENVNLKGLDLRSLICILACSRQRDCHSADKVICLSYSLCDKRVLKWS